MLFVGLLPKSTSEGISALLWGSFSRAQKVRVIELGALWSLG